MQQSTNKAIITEAMEGLAQGNGKKFVDAMADEFVWNMRGSTPWSGVYTGKPAVRKMLGQLFEQFTNTYRNTAKRIHADGDFVIVECKGDVMTSRNMLYDNDYCYVIKMKSGKMVELIEYFDTALVEAALDPPGNHAA